MPSRLTGFVCPTVSMVTTGHATGVEKTLLEGVSGAGGRQSTNHLFYVIHPPPPLFLGLGGRVPDIYSYIYGPHIPLQDIAVAYSSFFSFFLFPFRVRIMG